MTIIIIKLSETHPIPLIHRISIWLDGNCLSQIKKLIVFQSWLGKLVWVMHNFKTKTAYNLFFIYIILWYHFKMENIFQNEFFFLSSTLKCPKVFILFQNIFHYYNFKIASAIFVFNKSPTKKTKTYSTGALDLLSSFIGIM